MFYQLKLGSGSVGKSSGTWTNVTQEVEPEKEKVLAPVLEEAESLLYQIQDLGLVILLL